MKIKWRLKHLAVGVISSAFFGLGSCALAGGPEVPLPASWVIYIGGFGGIYVGSFDYSGTYVGASVAPNPPFIVPITSNFHQHGYSGGGQIGLRYYFTHRWFVGLGFTAMGNSETAISTIPIDSGAFDDLIFSLRNQFRINYNLDPTADLGVNITPRTRVYLKGGGSYARITHTLTVFDVNTPAVATTFQQTTRKNRWGYLIGFGFAYDFCRWIGIFSEYDYYDYGHISLNNLTNINPDIPDNGPDTYSQSVRVHAYSVRLGLNLNFDV